jgi:hypothetical protein
VGTAQLSVGGPITGYRNTQWALGYGQDFAMSKVTSLQNGAAQRPPEQVTLVYRQQNGAHSFSILEIPGLVVLDHDLERAFRSGIRGAGVLISSVCSQTVEYQADLSFEEFKAKIEQQEGTANRDHVVTIPSKIVHQTEQLACA